MMMLQGKKVWVMRDAQGPDSGFHGVVERVDGKWIFVKVDDPSGTTLGIWVNTELQREIAILTD